MGDNQSLIIGDNWQLSLWEKDDPVVENPEYLSRQLITYIGNKRALLGCIGIALERVKRRLGKNRLRVADLFSGSGVVSRYMKAHASLLISNDIEDYAAVTSRCYLRNRSTVDFVLLSEIVADLNARVVAESLPKGFIEEMYAPKDEKNITKEDRVFYTRENARRIDNYRRLIEECPNEMKDLLLGPLLSEASVHANTAGVFKGFYKNRHTGVEHFGGSGSDALTRILGRIMLESPVLSLFECDYEVFQEDANILARRLEGLDLVYIDPPYNQHPYGSNYFMLNLIVHYQRPANISRISGIPQDWRRSGYNVKNKALPLLKDLLEHIDASFILISFNNEGFIQPETMRILLEKIGKVDVIELPYNAFRGSRNFNNRSIYVTEYMFLVERR
ncbi:DNA adenine methylase [Roseiflexus castenholzii]|uniref:site-specific DNA-methyltransferase (adenine-specific) n=1 Tax=Roseiflexus castenholzii (strain DSM 13941 / HLO8) TaxID=383372 RepID=A7NJ54_ROSCS|nr:DNA adenine methylase [Roseiflexus castenholzii]ABU57520.1 Site-specific DNA-methyltransferase (adenine-specific) [Roseiflexus castenholzii DSM 13941]